MVAFLLLTALFPPPAAAHLSTWVFPATNGRLLYQPDELGNRILDYTAVGYSNGVVPIPDVPVKTNLAPVAGVDNGPRIQAAINYVATLPLTNGFRGAVFLAAGEYPISNSITIGASGIVLRGAGDGAGGTILRAAGPRPTADIASNHTPLIIVAGSGSASTSGTARTITNNYVPVGARSFNVNSTTGLSVGSRVLITRPSPTNWIHDIGMDLVSPAWTAGSFNVLNERFITRIEGNRIMLDAPLTCALEAQYGGGTIQPYAWSGRITNVGIEDLRGVSDFDPAVMTNTGAASDYYSDELHALDFIETEVVEHAWVRRVTAENFGYACVHLTGGTRAVTVRDCESLDPVSIITGGRRYAFSLADARNCLVQNCYNRSDRHQFVTDSLDPGPNVFVDGLSDNAQSDAGPHFRWGTGAIWDNITINGDSLDVRNRGNAGTSHGWAGANEVVWNSRADAFIVESPPTARNWLIGSIGLLGVNTLAVGPHPDGTYDSRNTNVFPNSLYYAQLQDRLAAVKVETREYYVGEINEFATASPTGTVVTVDAAWRAAIQAEAAGAGVNGFDIVTNNQFVPFTFNYTLGTTDRVVAATLALAMRSGANSTNEVLYLGATSNTYTFAGLGWNPVGTGTNTTVRLLDLGGQLGLFSTNGKLNVAVRDDVGIDWAMLELQVAPVQTLYTNTILPVADASVGGGTNAGGNFGTNTTLQVWTHSAANNQRQGYLRWNLAGYSGRVLHARVRLTPVSVGTDGVEQGVTLATTNTWSERALTWNNQPGGGRRFATWIPAASVPVEVVVTPQVQAVLAGDGLLSLQLYSLTDAGAAGLVSYASREDADPAHSPQLLLVVSNAVPNISVIADRTFLTNTSTGPIPFTISDPVSAANLLTNGAASSNTNLVPPDGLVLGGSSSNRTLTVTPVSGQTGSTLITVTVTNPAGATAASQFMLTVTNASGGTSASGAWIVDAGGDWNNPANWSGGIIATGADMTATFAMDVTAGRYVNNNSSRTIGNLTFNDASPGSAGGWFVTNNPLTLQLTTGTPAILVSNTTATIHSVVAGAQGLGKTGYGTLVLAGANTFGGAATISAGALRVANDSALGSTSAGTTIGNDASARLELSGDITVAEPLTLSCKGSASGSVPAVLNVGGTNTLAGTLSLTSGGSFWTFEAAAGKLRVTGTATNVTTTNVRTLWLRGAAAGDWLGVISDSAGGFGTAVRKDDAGAWTLSGNNAYTGPTVVSNGTLLVNGAVRGGAVSVYGGTLGGTGVLTALVTIYPGSTFAPGGLPGILTVSNQLILSDGSTTRMTANALAQTSDLVRGISNVAYAGTLSVSNLAGTPAVGQSFQLFSAASSAGNFAGIAPATPGAGLVWSFNPTNGTLFARASARPVVTRLDLDTNDSLIMSGTGPTDQPYRVLATTNLMLPLGDWTTLGTGTFAGGVFDFADPQATNNLRRFYRVVVP